MHRRLRFMAVLAIVSLLAWGAGFALAAEPKRGGTLRIAYGNKISHFDFHTAPGYELIMVAMNIGCGLVNITPDGDFVGDAASSWEVSPDGMTYTFKLRDNVYFHDDSKVDAEAVKFSIDRLMDPETKSGMRRFYEPVDRVEVVDPQDRAGDDETPLCVFLAHDCGLSHWSRALLALKPPRNMVSMSGKKVRQARWWDAAPLNLSSGYPMITLSWIAGKNITKRACPMWIASSFG